MRYASGPFPKVGLSLLQYIPKYLLTLQKSRVDYIIQLGIFDDQRKKKKGVVLRGAPGSVLVAFHVK